MGVEVSTPREHPPLATGWEVLLPRKTAVSPVAFGVFDWSTDTIAGEAGHGGTWLQFLLRFPSSLVDSLVRYPSLHPS